jgi:hypothetical protein
MSRAKLLSAREGEGEFAKYDRYRVRRPGGCFLSRGELTN